MARHDGNPQSDLKKDPVCGTYISAACSFKGVLAGGQVVHFCCKECRDSFHKRDPLTTYPPQTLTYRSSISTYHLGSSIKSLFWVLFRLLLILIVATVTIAIAIFFIHSAYQIVF